METKGKIGSVMVVGGGIAGMQSALDLAESGFKVYLVETSPSIGGRMAQLDKTFPTNDCAMCTLAPKMVDAGRHINIERLTYTDVTKVDGQPGHFQVTVRKKPRYIDISKCTGCGECALVCPVDLVNEFEQGLTKRKATYRRYAQAIPSAFAISKAARPPCKLTCPAGCNGQGYVALVSKGKYLEAVNHIKQWIPLPSTLGRICHHPCEQECNRRQVDEPVGIAPLKRFVADLVRQKRRDGSIPPEPKPVIDPTKPKVAVVGAGPSGLSCAYDLIKKGYPTTIFETGPKPGGQLQQTIPRYRLPKDVLQAEIQELIDLGIDLKVNSPIDSTHQSLMGLKAQGYQAIYLAIGAQKNQRLQIPGLGLRGVLLALDFLRDVNEDKKVEVGQKVAVVGGGNVAMDAARTAVRLGAKEVSIVYRRSEVEMPARPEEIEDAREDGVKFRFLSNPKQILGGNDRVTGMEYNEMELGEPDESGRRRPIPKATTSKLDCDTVIIAIGQSTDLSVLPQDSKIKTDRGGLITVDPVSLATDEPGVFAGGDVVTGPKSAVEAIAQGHEAAMSIERYLTGADLLAGREKKKEEPAPLPEGKHEKAARVKVNRIPLEQRISTFDELEYGYSEAEAKAEAERCLDCGLCSECLQCVAACEAKAIDHNMKEEIVEIPVGSVVLATGYEIIDPGLKKELGYGRYKNVVSSLQLERLLSASGPHMGTVLRPSDLRPPKKIAFIQCVGSREIDRNYCSSVCCMYATKEAIITKEHAPDTECTIFYIDLRAFGKGYEAYFRRAKELGVRYIRCRPSSVREILGTKNLVLRFEKEDGSLTNEEFDLVVLSAGMKPNDDAKRLADVFGIATDEFGFARNRELAPAETSRAGIYVAGVLAGPKDIPESVMEASAAAARAMTFLAESRGTLVKEKTYPPERDVTGQEPRIGVFVCHCGRNIAGVVDVKDVVAYASTLPNVVHAEDNVYTCSTDSCEQIKKMVIEHNLNRVIVASCTPRTHEPLFRDTIRQVGLNPYLFEMANIRDQCSWVHMHEPQKATKKAKDLVRIAVAKSRMLEPLYAAYVEVNPRGLVLGGGLAGMTAALELAKQGFETYLLEKSPELGGNLRRVKFLLDRINPQEKLDSLIAEVKKHPRLHVFTNAEVVDFEGSAGNFKTTFTANGEKHEIKHGAVIVATGAEEYRPTEYLYGQHPGVISQLELEEKLANGDFNARSVVMIQCVSSCTKPGGYCSRVCCGQAIKTALRIKETRPETNVFIIHHDMRTYGFNEMYYREARDKGVRFIRLVEGTEAEVTPQNGRVKLSVMDDMLKARLHIETDLLVLSTGIVPGEGNKVLAQKLKLPLTQDGFFLEAHLKLRPVDFASEGIFLCGLAHSPKTADESIAQAMAAAARAATILSKRRMELQAAISQVLDENCDGCAYCVEPCPYKAISLIEYVKDGAVKKTVDADPAKCQGCGVCQATCPKQGIFIRNFKVDQLAAMVEAALAE